MPDAKAFFALNPSYTILLNGEAGAGKTRSAMTFPKVFAIGCDPSGLDILYQEGNKDLAKNLVHFEYLHNENEEELKHVFATGKDPGVESVQGCLDLAKQMALDKAINTLLVDNFNYLVDMRWQYVNEFHKRVSKSGEVDGQAMYRDLGLYLNRFFGSNLMTMATRLHLNVVITCHIKRESPESLEGTKSRAGKVNKDSDVAPQIEGGFRQKIEGLVGASLYLMRKSVLKGDARVVTYKAFTQITPAMDTIVPAKNRYALPNPLDLTDKSLYDVLISCRNANLSELVKGSGGSK